MMIYFWYYLTSHWSFCPTTTCKPAVWSASDGWRYSQVHLSSILFPQLKDKSSQVFPSAQEFWSGYASFQYYEECMIQSHTYLSQIFVQYIICKMVKQQQRNVEELKHKTHKSLRDKLRKKREQIKQHKKEKAEKKKQYNSQQQKLIYFSQGENKERSSKKLKLKKIKQYIQKFINIYEDDLNQFYQLFQLLDDGGTLDISALENKDLMNCLKKLFKYLPLKKQNGEYKKIQGVQLRLEPFMRDKITERIEYYLQHGSNHEQSEQESSNEDKKEKKKKQKKSKKAIKEQENQDDMVPMKLYKQSIIQPEQNDVMGPFIPQGQRQKMAQLFQVQLEQLKKQKEQKVPEKQEDEFDQIFSMYQTRKEMKTPKNVPTHDVPEHLMAAGSALLGQKVQVDQESIDEYNKINRPKKLVQVHKEMMQARGQQDNNKRKPFNRQRDVMGQGKQSLMSNSTFFDFKSKMSKPKSTNQFL